MFRLTNLGIIILKFGPEIIEQSRDPHNELFVHRLIDVIPR
jgi:hypothetical protein